MANISSASGHIYFSDQFWQEHWRDVAKFVDSYQCAVYGITGMDMESTRLSFYGDGRWAFNSSLESFGGVPVPERENGVLKDPGEAKYEHNEAFLKLMAENNESFEIDFEDYEPGCVYRYDGRYRITPQWSMLDGITLVAEEIECRGVGTDDRSLIEDALESGFYVEEILNKGPFIEAAKELGLTPSQFADTLTAMPSYKGGLCSWRLETDSDYTELENANFEDIISKVREYLEKQQGRTT